MESNDSPEIPDRGETSDIPGLPSGGVLHEVICVGIEFQTDASAKEELVLNRSILGLGSITDRDGARLLR